MRFLKYAILSLLLSGCIKHDIPVCTDEQGLFEAANYPIGAAIDYSELQSNPVYRTIAERQFNSITAENIFKEQYLWLGKDVYDWQHADQLADFCLANGKRLHGHVLIWDHELPDWVEYYEGSRDDWEHLMETYIKAVVSHFKGKVHAWDVVNEAFNEDGTLRNTIWQQNIGDNYLELAFRWAHEADPDALLFYNDYNLEYNTAKRKGALAWLNRMLSRGVRVDGIGMQMHTDIYHENVQEFADAFQEVSDNGYKIHLSEFDISINPGGNSALDTSSLFAKQAELLSAIIQIYNQLPAKHQYGITFWGVADINSWKRGRNDFPLLYDDQYRPKPCYCSLKASL